MIGQRDRHIQGCFSCVFFMHDSEMSAMKTTFTAAAAKKNFPTLLHQVGESHLPVTIVGKKNNVVLVAEDDWRAIQETMYLCGIPGLRTSIVSGMREDPAHCVTKIEW